MTGTSAFKIPPPYLSMLPQFPQTLANSATLVLRQAIASEEEDWGRIKGIYDIFTFREISFVGHVTSRPLSPTSGPRAASR